MLVSQLIDNGYFCKTPSYEGDRLVNTKISKFFKQYHPKQHVKLLGEGTESVVIETNPDSSTVIKVCYVEHGRAWQKNAGKRWFDAPMKLLKRINLPFGKERTDHLIIYEQLRLTPMPDVSQWSWFRDVFKPRVVEPYLFDRDGSTEQWGWSTQNQRWYLLDYGAYDALPHKSVNRYTIRNTMGLVPPDLQ